MSSSFSKWMISYCSIIIATGSVNCQTQCPIGTFVCNQSVTCVEQRVICDGKSDCPNGSDEWNCKNEHHYQQWNNMFKKRPDADWELVASGVCYLENPPVECICADKKLFCDSRGFREVPKGLPLEATSIDLSNNLIQSLNRSSFTNLTNLQMLILSNCHIRQIGIGTFSSLSNLKSLYLTGNELTSLAANTFVNNIHLEILDVSFNYVSHITSGSFNNLASLIELDLRGNRISSIRPEGFLGLDQLQILYLSNNQLTVLSPDMMSPLIKLQSIYLTKNNIHIIEKHTFAQMKSLQGLYLAWNYLEHLQNGALDNLTHLLNLDLSENLLSNFELCVFDSLISLQSLDLRKNSFRKLPKGILSQLKNLTYVYFDEFSMCVYALHVRVCEPKGDGISSLENLLDSIVLRVSVWMVAILACLGNAFVLVGRLVIKEPNEVHSFYIKNLSLSDFFMGVYLFIIASYDVYFRGSYIRYDEQWRLSWQCNFCGFLSTLSSESSVFTLTVITVDRYVSISRPLSMKRRTKCYASMCVAIIWLFSAVLSALPLLPIPYYGDQFYGNNGVCLPLHIHNPFGQAWEYSAAMFILVNFLAFSFIFYAYLRMFIIIKNSTVSLRSTQEKQDHTIAKRFAFIVGTDFVCWMPIIIIKILALCGAVIHENLYAWLAVFVLPVNSALNPILYTLTTKLFRQQICHWIYNCKQNNKNRAVVGGQQDASGLSLSYIFFNRQSWSKRLNQSTSTTARSSIKSCSSIESMKKCRINGSAYEQKLQVKSTQV